MTKLICLNDPAGATGKDIYDFPAGMSATQMLMQVYPDGIDKDSCSIYINDIATVVGESPWLFEPLNEGDVVLFRNEPKGVTSLIYYAIVAVAAAVAVVALTPKPTLPGGMGSTKQSPNNTHQGQTNIARPYQGLPSIYGDPVSYPDLGGEPLVYYEDNKKYIEQLLFFGIGSHDVPPLRAGQTPFLNFEGATEEIIQPESRSDTYTSAITAYMPTSGNSYNLEVSIQDFDNFAENSDVIIEDLTVDPIVTGDLINLDGRYTVSKIETFDDAGTIKSRMTLKDPANANPNWNELDSRGGEGVDFATSPKISTANPEAVTSNTYSFAINEVDGQELIASNQGAEGISASTTSLVTPISYTAGSDFTFSVLSSTDWDDIKSDLDASTIDYYVQINYLYNKEYFPGSFDLVSTIGGGILSSMTLVTDPGGDYYDVVVTGFDGLVGEGVTPYGSDLTMTERVGETLGPFVTPIECDAFFVNVIFTRGLKWTDVFEIITNQTDSAGTVVPGTTETFDKIVGANTLDQQFRTFGIQPSFGRSYYSISVRRTDNSPNSAENPDLASLEAINCLLFDSNRNFGNVTLAKTRLPATINATSLRENKINTNPTRKPITYNTTTGQVDYTLTASKRFADALLHEYVITFSRDPNELDLDTLYEIQERIDAVEPELGEFVYTFDDLDVSLDERMDTILNVARCFKWQDGDVYRFGREEAKEFAENVITQRDIAADEERDYSTQYLSTMPSDYDSIKLEYIDRTTNKKAYIYRKLDNGLIVNSAGLRPDTIQLAGCSSKIQAEDRADLEIRKRIYTRFIVTETCLSQCSLLDKGQLVRYSDQYNFSLSDGEILAIDGDIAYTSNGIDWEEGESYFVDFKDEYNNVYRSSISEVTGNNKAFQVASSGILNNAYLPTGTEQLGSVYIVGTSFNLESSTWTVSEKKPANNGNVTLTLTNYDERVFEKDLV